MPCKYLALLTLGVANFVCPVWSAEQASFQDFSFDVEETSYHLTMISAERALQPQTPEQEEAISFIRGELDKPIDGKNLTGRKTNADGFLKYAAQTQDSLLVLYHESTPIGFARVTELTKLMEMDTDGKFITTQTKENIASHGLLLEHGYVIGGELSSNYRRQGYMTKLASSIMGEVLPRMLPAKNNAYAYICVFVENEGMNKICQNVLKCEPLNGGQGTFSQEHSRNSNEYIYRFNH